jgi:hypothetical protein
VADSGGHWVNLAAAEKLTQDEQVPGFIEEDLKRGNPALMLPVQQQTGTNLKWLREKVVGSAQRADIGSQLVWTDESDYDEITRRAKIIYKQTPLNNYVKEVYSSFNNYAAIQNREITKAMIRQMGDDIIYADTTNGGANQPNGLHALAALYPTALNGTTDGLNIDQGSAGLSLGNMRLIEQRMRHGIDMWLFPFEIAAQLDAYVQENGVSTFTASRIQITMDSVGQQLMTWNGKPIVRSDYLVAEQLNTGLDSTSTRDKHSSSAENFSIFALKLGHPALQDPGVGLIFGGNNRDPGELMKTTFFPTLEDFDASGLRKTSYYNVADGSIMAIGRVADITNVAIVV